MTLSVVDRYAVRDSGYECACCHITYVGSIKADRPQRICEACKNHAQGGEMQKAHEHTAAWKGWREQALAEIGMVRDELAASTQRSRQIELQNTDLRRAIRDGLDSVDPTVLSGYFETEAVVVAQAQRDSAYRARDKVMALVWKLGSKHSSTLLDATCSSGRARCDVPDILEEFWADFERWERVQVERARAGKPNHLPPGHPGARRFVRSFG